MTRSGKQKPDPKSKKAAPPNAAPDSDAAPTGFHVSLDNFTGPFDLLLQLIGKHQLDVTELALHRVTDEFIAYLRAMGDDWDLDETSEFLVIAATLLDLKAAKLLPTGDVEDEEDLALLEARDLLFARLLQYKAFKEAAAYIAVREALLGRGFPRVVGLEPRYAEALPDLVLGIGPDRLAQLAAKALTPRPVPTVSIDHIHLVRVSIREHAAILREKLLRLRTATFRALCSDCRTTLEVVARFLALLELYREGMVGFDQIQALGELTVRWIGGDSAELRLDIDEYGEASAEPPEPGDADAPALAGGAGEVAEPGAAAGMGAPAAAGELSPASDPSPASEPTEPKRRRFGRRRRTEDPD
ncbi:MAG: segregation and condensation protein A [Micromonosporaceae bacterium]